MKSFGVRLGAGAITVVLAAYLMLNSQKSEPEDVSQWTAENGAAQAPADPLSTAVAGDSLESGWLQQPKTNLLSANDQPAEAGSNSSELTSVMSTPSTGAASSGGSSVASGDVRLVQHDEDNATGAVATAFGATLPSTLSASQGGQNESAGSQGVASDDAWLLPSGDSVQGESVAVSGDVFALPGAVPSQEISASSSDTVLAVPSIPNGETGMIPSIGAEVESNAGLAVGFGVPVADAESPAAEANGAESAPVASAAVAPTVTTEMNVGLASQPANLLRGGFEGENALRGSEQPADLGYSFDEPTVTASSATGMTQVGSGMVSASQPVGTGQSVGTNPALSVETRLPSIQDLDEEPVGNGLRDENPVGMISDNSGYSNESAAIAAVEQNQNIQSRGLESGKPEMGVPGRLGGVEDFALTNPIRDQSPIEVEPAGSESVSVLEVAPSAPSLGVAGNPVAGNPLVYGSDAFSASNAIPSSSAASSMGASVNVEAMGNPIAIATRPAAVATMDSPGERRLEGAQTPSVVIQKRAPSEVRVGKAASFIVNVQNVGVADALNVEVYDRIPAGMRFVEASPAAQQVGNQLMWELGSMAAGEQRTITMQLVPEQEGELGSVARVSFEAAASVRTLSTKPELKIVQRVPEQGVLIGQQLEIEIEVSNPGSGAANGVVLQEDVPEGLEHPRGRQLDNALGSLAPGEVRRQVLRLRAVRPGVVENTIRLVSDDGLETEHSVAVQVIAPDLQVQLNGPSRRFLERPATYELLVANQGTADATNLEIAVHLDRGFTFVSTENEGYYDPNRHAVFWSLANLPAGAQGIVPLTLLPVEIGEQAIRIEADGDLGVAVQSQRTMSVEGFAELTFAINNPGGPIEIGAETEYEVTVTNTGSMADSGVRVQLQLPVGLELVSASGDAGTNGQGLVAFQPITALQPNQTVKQTIRVRGLNAGVHLVKAVVVSEQSAVPVTKEESTRVYADQ
ncbi:MAG: hypothetical protein ACON4H_10485 [Rubripirellula sp.]